MSLIYISHPFTLESKLQAIESLVILAVSCIFALGLAKIIADLFGRDRATDTYVPFESISFPPSKRD